MKVVKFGHHGYEYRWGRDPSKIMQEQAVKPQEERSAKDLNRIHTYTHEKLQIASLCVLSSNAYLKREGSCPSASFCGVSEARVYCSSSKTWKKGQLPLTLDFKPAIAASLGPSTYNSRNRHSNAMHLW